MSKSENRLRIFFNPLFNDSELVLNDGDRTFLFLRDIINVDTTNLLTLLDGMVPWIRIDGNLLVADTPLGTINLDFDHVTLAHNNIIGEVGVRLRDFAPEVGTLPRLPLREGVPFAFDVAPYLNYGSPHAQLFVRTPTWVTRTGTVFSGTPPDLADARVEEIILQLINTIGSSTGTLFLDIENNIVPRPVRILTIPLQTGDEFEMFRFDPSPYLVEGHPPGTFEWVSVPDWATVNGRIVEGIIPGRMQATDWQFTLRWYNESADETAVVTLRVGDTHFSPVWSDIPDQTAILTEGYSLNLNNFVSAGPDASVVTVLDVVNGYTETNGVFSGFGNVQIPTRVVRARATNSQGSTDTTFMFRAIPRERGPSIETIPQQFLDEGDNFRLDVEPFLDRGFPEATLLAKKPSWVLQSGSVFTGVVPNRGMDIQEQIMLTLANDLDTTRANVDLIIGNTLFPPMWQDILVQTVVQGTPHTLNANNFVSGGPRPAISSPNPLPVGFTLVDGIITTDGTLFGIHNIPLVATNTEGVDTTTVQFRIEPDMADTFPARGTIFGMTFVNDRFFILRHDNTVDEHSAGGLYLRSFPVSEATTEDHPLTSGANTDGTHVYILNSRTGIYAYDPSTGDYVNLSINPLHLYPFVTSLSLIENGTVYVWNAAQMRAYRAGEDPVTLWTYPDFDVDNRENYSDASAYGYGYFWITRWNGDIQLADRQGRFYEELQMTLPVPSDHRASGATFANGILYVGTFEGDVYRFDVPLSAPVWDTAQIDDVFPRTPVRINLRDHVSHNGIPNSEISLTPGSALTDGFELDGDDLIINVGPGNYTPSFRVSNSQGFDDRIFGINVDYPSEHPVLPETEFNGMAIYDDKFWFISNSGHIETVDAITNQIEFPGQSTAMNAIGMDSIGDTFYVMEPTLIRRINPLDLSEDLLPVISLIDYGESFYGGFTSQVSSNMLNFWLWFMSFDTIYSYNLALGMQQEVPYSLEPPSGERSLTYVDIGLGFYFAGNDSGYKVYSNGVEVPSLAGVFTASDNSDIEAIDYGYDAIYVYDEAVDTIYRHEIYEAPVWDEVGDIRVVPNERYTVNLFDYLNTALVEFFIVRDGIESVTSQRGIQEITLGVGEETTLTFRVRNPRGSDDVTIRFVATNPLSTFPLHPDNSDPQALDSYENYHYVLDGAGNRIFVYDRVGNRIESREIELDATLFDGAARGMAFIGNIAHISRGIPNSEIYATLFDGTRIIDNDFVVQGIIQGLAHIELEGQNHIVVTRVQNNVQYITTYRQSGSVFSDLVNPIVLGTALMRGVAVDLDEDNIFVSGSDGTIYVMDTSLNRRSDFDFMAQDIRGLYYRDDRLWGVDSMSIRSWDVPNTFAGYTGDTFDFDEFEFKDGLATANSQIITISHGTQSLEVWGQNGLVRSHPLHERHTSTDHIAYRDGYIYIIDDSSVIHIYRLTGEYVTAQRINASSPPHGITFGHNSDYIYLVYSSFTTDISTEARFYTDYLSAHRVTNDTTIAADETLSERLQLGGRHVRVPFEYGGAILFTGYSFDNSGAIFAENHYHVLVRTTEHNTPSNVGIDEDIYVFDTSGTLVGERRIDSYGYNTLSSSPSAELSAIKTGSGDTTYDHIIVLDPVHNTFGRIRPPSQVIFYDIVFP